MNWLCPRIESSEFRVLLKCAGSGSLVAGSYGILHDQITYTISPEYFTHLKFEQFSYADFGLPDRIFVAVIGFLATFWVGIFVGWFVGRGLSRSGELSRYRSVMLQSFAIVFGSTMIFGLGGYGYGLWKGPDADYGHWTFAVRALGVKDAWSFIRVAYIHNVGYLGALVGLFIAMICMSRKSSGT